MKPSDFDAQFTAWLDGRIPADERAAFEQKLVERGFDPDTERRAADGLRKLLRSHSATPELPNPEFFSHQVRYRISQETPVRPPAGSSRWRWTVPRLAFAGAVCLLFAALLFQLSIPRGATIDRSPYFAEIIDARPMAAGITANTVYTPEDNVTIVWLEGLDSLPADYQLQ
jgi:anti-sigma factor RsiW